MQGLESVIYADTFRTDPRWTKRKTNGLSIYICCLNFDNYLVELTVVWARFLFVVLSLEVVHVLEVENVSFMVKKIGGMWFVHCMEVICISEGPLSEVSLYISNANVSSDLSVTIHVVMYPKKITKPPHTRYNRLDKGAAVLKSR